ncbi:MAG: hypothetical protein M1834_008079 [Cirrosporium novae-zelandiae]|nr:MAG: hypothetical protein M1834_008079 [Cirrosporium novae-zelandiae]
MATEFFTNSSKSADNLVNELNYLDYKCKDTTLMAPFSENHDQPRFASYTDDMVLAKNIIAFTMLSDGIPISTYHQKTYPPTSQLVSTLSALLFFLYKDPPSNTSRPSPPTSVYQGQEQHYNGTDDPYDREALWLSSYNTTAPLYQFIKSLNAIRQLAIAKSSSSSYLTSHSKIIHNDTNTIAIRKGSEPGGSMVLMVVNNRGQEAERYNIEVADVGFEVGVRVLDVLACGEGVVVGSGGGLNVTVLGGMPAQYRLVRSLRKSTPTNLNSDTQILWV